jgi:putative phosphoribosyl transferase
MDIEIPLESVTLNGILIQPQTSSGIILFAHGSGSSRLSPRNNQVAAALNNANLTTLLFDLLTIEEERIDIYTREYRFDIPLLASRLIDVTQWVLSNTQLKHLPIGYFGSSTGAAAALIAAAHHGDAIKAVVSRGGRPDLAGDFLSKVLSPTLFIVGDLDLDVIDLNQQAKAKMMAQTTLKLIPGATHLFEETGTLEKMTIAARDFFLQYI